MPNTLRLMTEPRICSRINNKMASSSPTPAAAIRLTPMAVATTAAITRKSNTVVFCLSRRKLLRSNIRQATTIRMPAKAAMGSQQISQANATKATMTNTPSRTPDRRVFPPLLMFTSVAPMVPAPGMPPIRAEAKLATPWPISSRLELWRRWVRVSMTTQVFRVSIESSTDSVMAGMKRLARSENLTAPRAAQRSCKRGGHGRIFAEQPTDHQLVMLQCSQFRQEVAQAKIGQKPRSDAHDRGRHGFGQSRSSHDARNGNQSDHNPGPLPVSRRRQSLPDRNIIGQPEQLGQLTDKNKHAHAAEVSGYDGVGDVFDETAAAQRAIDQL